MPIFFKIFLFLFLQQGMKTGGKDDRTGSVNWESVLVTCPGNSTLIIQADPIIIEQVLNICTLQDISCEIKREPLMSADPIGMDKATVSFKNLQFTVKNRMMNQLKNLQMRMDMQWSDL